VYSRVAGVFLFVPLLVQAGLGGLVEQARMAGTKRIPAVSYVLSLLALKLLDKERKSPITDWNFEEALGWGAYVRGNVHVHPIDANHSELLGPRGIGQVGPLMHGLLENDD